MVSFIHALPNIDLLPKLKRSRRTPLPSSCSSPELRRWLSPQPESQRPLGAFQNATLEQLKEDTGIKYPFKSVTAQARLCTTQLWQTWNLSDYPETDENKREEIIEFEDSSDESESEPDFFSGSDSNSDEETDLEETMTKIYKRWESEEVVDEESEFWKKMSKRGNDDEDVDMDGEDDDDGSSGAPLVRFSN